MSNVYRYVIEVLVTPIEEHPAGVKQLKAALGSRLALDELCAILHGTNVSFFLPQKIFRLRRAMNLLARTAEFARKSSDPLDNLKLTLIAYGINHVSSHISSSNGVCQSQQLALSIYSIF